MRHGGRDATRRGHLPAGRRGRVSGPADAPTLRPPYRFDCDLRPSVLVRRQWIYRRHPGCPRTRYVRGAVSAFFPTMCATARTRSPGPRASPVRPDASACMGSRIRATPNFWRSRPADRNFRLCVPEWRPGTCISDWAYEGGAFCFLNNVYWGVQMAAEQARLARDVEAFEALYAASRESSLAFAQTLPA